MPCEYVGFTLKPVGFFDRNPSPGRPVPTLSVRFQVRLATTSRQLRRDRMAWNYRKGVVITFMSEDGRGGPGNQQAYQARDGWTVEFQDEGCIHISNYQVAGSPDIVLPWHRIYEVRMID